MSSSLSNTAVPRKSTEVLATKRRRNHKLLFKTFAFFVAESGISFFVTFVPFVAYLNASSGSIFAALRAGTRHATSTTAANTIATATNVIVSTGFTPNNNVVR